MTTPGWSAKSFIRRLFLGPPRFAARSFSPAPYSSPSSGPEFALTASATRRLTIRDCFRYSAPTVGAICLKGVDVSRLTGPEMMSGVRASSIRIESTSSTIA